MIDVLRLLLGRREYRKVKISKNRRIFDYIDDMQPFVRNGEWDSLEESYRAVCEKLAGTVQAKKVEALDFPSYENKLRSALSHAAQRLVRTGTKALYFEYDMDNAWRSGFFLCHTYNPQEVGNDEWACEYADDFEGPDFEAAGDVYLEDDGTFDETKKAMGTTLYLIARTVAAFGRCVESMEFEATAVCLAFHDQDPVVRIFEASN